MLRLACAVAGAFLFSVFADAAQEGCPECGDLRFPEADAFLAANGFPSDQLIVALTWDEAAPADPGQRVAGYHVIPKDGSPPFDLYSDADGRLLDSSAMAALGIRPKNWNLRPRETQAQRPRPAVMRAAPRPIALSAMPGRAPSGLIALPPIDLDAVRREDAAGLSSPHKGVVRTGVFQQLPERIVLDPAKAGIGAWETLPDGGKLWGVAIHSPAAKGIRVHFAALRLPSQARVTVYNADDPSETYHARKPAASAAPDYWAPTCFGDTVVVECYVPAAAAASLTLDIDRVIHVYKGLGDVPWAPGGYPAGWCNLDVTCYPGWADTALGVGGLGTVGDTGSLWCTGSLIVDTDASTDTPYVLTANHCIRGQYGTRGADTTEVYWLYQTDVCDGIAPDPADVPRTTGGADYLAGSAGTGRTGGGTDFTFMRLRQAPPPEIAYLGWTTMAPPLATEVTCIHHPSGDFKRISFGNLTDTENEFSDLYHEVIWHDGTTEHGSSGSPLMRTDTHQVIGQLWGGDASCSALDAPDFYGRFDVSFAIIQQYLDPPGDLPQLDFENDAYEVVEDDAVVTITVVADAWPGAPVTVDYATSDQSAKAGEGYIPASGTLVIEGTANAAAFEIQIISDTHTDLDETLLVTLSKPVGCSLAGLNNPVSLTILDDDPDSDDDGLSDYDEENGVFGYTSDPNEPDTDGDGLSDYDEVMGTNGFVTDPNLFTELSALSVPFFK